MDTEKIATLIEIAEESIENLESENADTDEKSALQWRAMSSLADAKGLANAARVRAKGQVLFQRLTVAECDRLVVRCRRAIGGDR
jgi:hypothetical protein